MQRSEANGSSFVPSTTIAMYRACEEDMQRINNEIAYLSTLFEQFKETPQQTQARTRQAKVMQALVGMMSVTYIALAIASGSMSESSKPIEQSKMALGFLGILGAIAYYFMSKSREEMSLFWLRLTRRLNNLDMSHYEGLINQLNSLHGHLTEAFGSHVNYMQLDYQTLEQSVARLKNVTQTTVLEASHILETSKQVMAQSKFFIESKGYTFFSSHTNGQIVSLDEVDDPALINRQRSGRVMEV